MQRLSTLAEAKNAARASDGGVCIMSIDREQTRRNLARMWSTVRVQKMCTALRARALAIVEELDAGDHKEHDGDCAISLNYVRVRCVHEEPDANEFAQLYRDLFRLVTHPETPQTEIDMIPTMLEQVDAARADLAALK